MTRSAILPPANPHEPGSSWVSVELTNKRTVAPSPPDPFRAAAEAVTQLARTLRDCAREVESRGGQRVARESLSIDRVIAIDALSAVLRAIGAPCAMLHEAQEMVSGCRYGYVRESWALRIVQMGAEVASRCHLRAESWDGCGARVPDGPYAGCVCTLKGAHDEHEAWSTPEGKRTPELLESWSSKGAEGARSEAARRHLEEPTRDTVADICPECGSEDGWHGLGCPRLPGMLGAAVGEMATTCGGGTDHG